MNNTGRGSEGCFITCSKGMDSYHVLAKCGLLDDIETNSCWLKGEVNDVENNPGPAVFNREFKQIATAGATTAAVTEKVWGEYVAAVCQILAK